MSRTNSAHKREFKRTKRPLSKRPLSKRPSFGISLSPLHDYHTQSTLGKYNVTGNIIVQLVSSWTGFESITLSHIQQQHIFLAYLLGVSLRNDVYKNLCPSNSLAYCNGLLWTMWKDM